MVKSRSSFNGNLLIGKRGFCKLYQQNYSELLTAKAENNQKIDQFHFETFETRLINLQIWLNALIGKGNNILISQLVPLNPAGHIHLYPFTSSTQVPFP